MNRYAIVDAERGRIIVASSNAAEIYPLIKEYRKAGYEVAFVRILKGNLWEYLDEEV